MDAHHLRRFGDGRLGHRHEQGAHTSRSVSMRRQPSLPVASREALLAWYAPRARAYPWRRGRPSAYRTLVSELMLQQTQASRVAPVSRRSCARFPPCRRSRPPRVPTCCARGRGSATTAARCRCTAPRGRSWPFTAAGCRPIRRRCGRCPASGRTRRRPSPRSRAVYPSPRLDVNVRRIVARVAFAAAPPASGRGGRGGGPLGGPR